MTQDPSRAKQMDEQLDFSADQSAASEGSALAARSAAEKVEERIQNPNFFSEVRDEDVDSAVFDWISAELGPVFSDAKVVGNRQEDYERQRELLNPVVADELVTERTPGRIAKQDPHVLATMQETGGPNDPEYRDAITPRKERAVRHAMHVATNLESLSVNAKGLESVTTATTETRTTKRDAEDQSSLKERVKGVVR